MTPDKLNEMASNMESLAASDYDLYIRERDELLEAARYLRACAEAEPVAWLEGPYGEFRANPLYRIAAPQSVAWSIPLFAGKPEEPR